MGVELSEQTKGKIDLLQKAIGSARSTGVRMHPESLSGGIGPEAAANVKQLGRDIMGTVLNVDANGTPKGPLEIAAQKAVSANADQVRERIASLMAKGTPTTADYYDILHKVLSDSGSVMLTDPKLVRGAVSNLKDNCGVCHACSACSACAGCAASVVEGLVVAGVAGLAAGTYV
jgi:hypothetical protein